MTPANAAKLSSTNSASAGAATSAAAADCILVHCVQWSFVAWFSLVVLSRERCLCGVKLKDRFPSRELSERLGIDDIITLVLQQNRLR